MNNEDFKLQVTNDLTYIRGKIDNVTDKVKTNRKMIYSIFTTATAIAIGVIIKLVG